jgi:hypothetical protein
MGFDLDILDATGQPRRVGIKDGMPMRGFPSDRNAARWIQAAYVGFNVAPHSTTQRQVYVVPAGKHALVLGCFAHLRRRTAASTADQARIETVWYVNGSGNLYQVNGSVAVAGVSWGYATLYPSKNAVDDQVVERYESPLWLPSGVSFTIQTIDLSTGGTVDYIASAMILEYTP